MANPYVPYDPNENVVNATVALSMMMKINKMLENLGVSDNQSDEKYSINASIQNLRSMISKETNIDMQTVDLIAGNLCDNTGINKSGYANLLYATLI